MIAHAAVMFRAGLVNTIRTAARHADEAADDLELCGAEDYAEQRRNVLDCAEELERVAALLRHWLP